MNTRLFTRILAAGALAAGMIGSSATAQDVTLRLHQFLPPPAPVPSMILKPWAESVEEASGGRIAFQHFDAMSLGGRPPELMDQARDGVADIIMTLVGYTPGRFPRTEVFELPFMMTDPVATASAFWEMVETDWQESEYGDVQILGAWVHGPGLIHTKDGVESLEDMSGVTMRGPTRIINNLLSELGATPVGMPLPAIPEALSKGVVKGTVVPWEVTSSIRLAELVENHTEFAGDEALYTATIVLAMNKAKYDALPDDLKAILDAESGAKLSAFATQVMYDMDAPAREIAVNAGNTIVELDEAEVARWKEAAQPVIDDWIAEMNDKGIDGAALIEQARGLIAKHGG
ncbi:TRAP transporter substrate-binding protein [Poseidonocella sedimentorum]|uniref:TRAP-type C4-dicarboxylate transport system, substrate-binding protein n=1 Tax=Poseidonocella sedimentorum TaxID=871652 RepID=A0A1I6E4I0_9RHOB|nr:TRAP transporter substrate-binding protein [Poseidonocella sedimentorum]SFR12660.1 TRAP-type C4-dicarboxylate transport system, substrate-binding protein [Poseidonocella sedimentorum]